MTHDTPQPVALLPNAMRGIALKIASVCIFTVMSLIIKSTAEAVPAGEAVFFRSLFGIPVIMAWLIYLGDFPGGVKTGNPLGHLWRGLAGVTAMSLMFAALGLLPFSDVVAIGYAAPIFATILAAMLLGEKIRIFRLSAVAIGLAGVVVILYPNLALIHQEEATALQALGAVMALAGATFAAIAQVFTRQLVQTERSSAIVFWFHVTAATLSLTTLAFGWTLPSPGTLALLIVSGLLGGLGQIFLTEAYRHAETSLIASFEYTSMLLAVIAGYLLFSEVPTMPMIAGASLIVVAGLFIVFREHQLGLRRNAARKVMTPQG